MAILHIQRTSVFNKSDFDQCLLAIQENDALVFIDDGCYNLHYPAFLTLQASSAFSIYHIEAHAHARGIKHNNSHSTSISMDKLVALTFQYDTVITWQ